MTSDKKSYADLKKRVGYFLPFLFTIVFLYLSFKDVDISEAINLISQLSFGWLLVFLLVFMFSHWLRALRWKFIIQSVKPDASLWNLMGATMIGYGVNCVIPRLGELYRALFIGKWENLSRTSMFGTVIVERMIDVIALAFSVLVSVMIYSGNLYEEIVWLKSTVIAGFIAIFAVILFLGLLIKFKKRFSDMHVMIVGKISKKLAGKLQYVLETLIDGFATIKTFKSFIFTFLLSAIIMVVYGLNSLIGFYVLNLDDVYTVNYAMAWVLMTISAFGIVIPTPGGTGSYHFITISVLTMLYSFTTEAASAFALLTHLISTVTFLSSMFFFVFVINNKRAKMGFPREDLLTVIKSNRRSDEKDNPFDVLN